MTESDSESKIIRSANLILSQLTVPKRIARFEEIDSDLFVTLYEGLTGDTLPDVIKPSRSEEDDSHNVQCVIDSLAMDVLHTSLAHISGQDVVRRRTMSIMNLLDIFTGLLEYILDGIEKEEVLSQASLPESDNNEFKAPPRRDSARSTSSADTAELIALGDPKYLASPSASPVKKKTRFSTSVKPLAERRRKSTSKRVTPNVINQPIASSSMASINPSGTETESDASSVAAAGGKAKRIPADFSPERQDGQQSSKDTTFTIPDNESERRRLAREKLAEEILRTGESTEELIELANPQARGVQKKKKAFTVEKTTVLAELPRSDPISTNIHSKTDLHVDAVRVQSNVDLDPTKENKSNNALTKQQRAPATTQSVPAVSPQDQSGSETATSDYTTVKSPLGLRQAVSDPIGLPAKDKYQLSEETGLGARLQNYYKRKEAGEFMTPSPAACSNAGSSRRRELSHPENGDIQSRSNCGDSYRPAETTALAGLSDESGTTLYERVAALRAAAGEKLSGLRGSIDQPSARYQSAYAQSQIKPSTDPSPSMSRDSVTTRSREGAYTTTQSSAPRTSEPISLSFKESKASVRFPTDPVTSYHSFVRDRSASRDRDAPTVRTTSFHTAPSTSYDLYQSAREAGPRDDDSTDISDFKTAPSLTEPPIPAARLSAGRDGAENVSRDEVEDYHEVLCRLSPVEGSLTGDYRTALDVSQQSSDFDPLRTQKFSDLPLIKPSDLPTRVMRSAKRTRPPTSTSAAQGSTLSSRSIGERSRTTGETRVSSNEFQSLRSVLEKDADMDKRQQRLLRRQYKRDLDDMITTHHEELVSERRAVRRQDREFSDNVRALHDAYDTAGEGRASGGSRQPTARTAHQRGFLLPKTRIIKKVPSSRSTECSDEITAEQFANLPLLDPNSDDFLPRLQTEFPHLHVEPETLRKMWLDHQAQSEGLKRALANDQRRRNAARATVEDAERKQEILMNIMQKELEHNKRIRQLKDRTNNHLETRRQAREKKQQSARIRKYYDDYSLKHRAVMLKNRNREETLFRRLFREGLRVQKERMRELRDYTREHRDKRSKQQKISVEALEKFYRDQFALLTESVAEEKKKTNVRDKAQNQVLDRMKRELRKKMEADIENFQSQLQQDDDDYFYRELDAQCVVQQLNVNRLQAGI